MIRGHIVNGRGIEAFNYGLGLGATPVPELSWLIPDGVKLEKWQSIDYSISPTSDCGWNNP